MELKDDYYPTALLYFPCFEATYTNGANSKNMISQNLEVIDDSLVKTGLFFINYLFQFII